jgi:hypothetical protein
MQGEASQIPPAQQASHGRLPQLTPQPSRHVRAHAASTGAGILPS